MGGCDILATVGLNPFFSALSAGGGFPLERFHHQRDGIHSERLADALSRGLSPNIVLPSCPLPTLR